MKLYPFLSCLPFFLLPTFSNPLPAIDNSARLEFIEISSPPFAGPLDSQPLQNEGSTIQVDKGSNLNPLLFTVASENPDSQIENFSQTSISEGRNPGSSESVCDDGSKNVNKYRLRRDEGMCAVKERDEDRDWDTLWSTFSKTRALRNGEAPACTNPDHPVHVCCRGPPSRYAWNQNLMRMVKNCFPCKLSPAHFIPYCHSGIANMYIYMLTDLMFCPGPYFNLCCKEFEVKMTILGWVDVHNCAY